MAIRATMPSATLTESLHIWSLSGGGKKKKTKQNTAEAYDQFCARVEWCLIVKLHTHQHLACLLTITLHCNNW